MAQDAGGLGWVKETRPASLELAWAGLTRRACDEGHRVASRRVD